VFPIKGEIGLREENAFLQQFKPPGYATCGVFSESSEAKRDESPRRRDHPEGPTVLVDSGRLVIATRGGAAICPFKQADLP